VKFLRMHKRSKESFYLLPMRNIYLLRKEKCYERIVSEQLTIGNIWSARSLSQMQTCDRDKGDGYMRFFCFVATGHRISIFSGNYSV